MKFGEKNFETKHSPRQSRTSAVADDDRSRTRRRGRCWMGHGCWPTKRTMTTGRPACKLLQLTPDLKQMWCKPMERKSIRFHSPCIFWKEKHGFIWHFSAACMLTWSGRSSVHTACGCCTRTFWPYLLPCRRGNKLEGHGTRVASSDKYSRAYEILV